MTTVRDLLHIESLKALRLINAARMCGSAEDGIERLYQAAEEIMETCGPTVYAIRGPQRATTERIPGK
jgi:hypothetical protein